MNTRRVTADLSHKNFQKQKTQNQFIQSKLFLKLFFIAFFGAQVANQLQVNRHSATMIRCLILRHQLS
jgi:hypothetical protein